MVTDAVSSKEGGEAQGVNSLVSSYGSSVGTAVITALITSHVVSPRLPIPAESGYTHGFAVAGFAGVGILVFALLSLTTRRHPVEESAAVAPSSEHKAPSNV